mgnify:CR=1 FL=1
MYEISNKINPDDFGKNILNQQSLKLETTNQNDHNLILNDISIILIRNLIPF